MELSLGIIRYITKEAEVMESQEELFSTIKPKWDQTPLDSIHVVLEDFIDVFPKDLTLRHTPVYQGH